MDAEKKPEGAAAPAGADSPKQTAPKDALDKTNEELASDPGVANAKKDEENGKPAKKIGPLKKFYRRFNVYLLLFILVVVIAVIISIVVYLNGQKTPTTPSVASQTLTPSTLKQLANSDATVGDSGQTLTIQGNAVVSGQLLVRSNLNVAGTIALGGTLTVPGLTVSGQTNLAATQVNSLQVANGTTFQGAVTMQNNLNVAGAAAFNGAVTIGDLTVTKLTLSGNAQLSVPNHISFPGSPPGRSINTNALGGGGSASVNGSDTSGTVNVNTGNSPQAGCFVTVNFAKAYASTPHVMVTPIGAGAGAIGFYVTRDTSGFSVCGNTAAPANQVMAFDYFVTD